MTITIGRRDGYWHMLVNGKDMRTPYSSTEPRISVVAYALRAFPGARIFDQ